MDQVSGDILFLAGAALAAAVAAIGGFAFGLIAAAIWLHALPPAETVPLIAAYGLIVQGYAVWRLRSSLDFKRLLPFIIGSAVGIPLGIAALAWISPAYLRIGIGVLLIGFSLYNLLRPAMPTVRGSLAADTCVGILNGIIGGATALAGIAVVIWSSMRDWRRDEQRAVFQPVGVATFLMLIVGLGWSGGISTETQRKFVLGLPALGIGTAFGWWLYAKFDEASFRKIVLIVLAISGALLAIPIR